MHTIYFDWARGKVTTLLDNTDDIIYYPSLTTLLDSLHEPTRLISEATFESYQPDVRAALIERATAAGHIWLTTPNRLTGRHRRAMGFADAAKTDELDVTVIRDLALTKPQCLKTPNVRPEGDRQAQLLSQANQELRDLRRTYRMVDAPRTRLGFKTVSAKDEYAATVIASLPDYRDLDSKLQAALGNGKEYSAVLVAACAKAAKFSANRADFEHLTGLYVHGYPSQIRSDVHHWRWRFVREGGKGSLAGAITISEFRRGIRWLYHRLDELRAFL